MIEEKKVNIEILSPFNGIALMGIVSVWATTKFVGDDFKFWLLALAVGCIFAAAIGDYLHHKFKNKYEKLQGKDGH